MLQRVEFKDSTLWEKILTDYRARAIARKSAIVSFLVTFSFFFLLFYFWEEEPWLVFGKSLFLGIFGFLVTFYAVLFSVIAFSRGETGEQGKADRGTSSIGAQDSSEA